MVPPIHSRTHDMSQGSQQKSRTAQEWHVKGINRRVKTPANHTKKEKKHRKTKSGVTGKGKVKHASDTLDATNVQATALAAPIPAGDLQSTGSTLTVTLPPTATPVFIDPSITQELTTELESSMRKTTTIWITPSSVSGIAAATHSSTTSIPSSPSGHLPIFVFALIAVGATCFSLGALLVIRNLCIRRTYSARLRPSAPILQESPLFGGKERFSGRLWADQSFGNLLGTSSKKASYAGKGPGWRPLSGGNASELTKVNEKAYLSAVSPFADPSPKSANIPLSPASVYTQAAPTTPIGLAVDYPLPPPPMSAVTKPTQPLKVKDKPLGRANSKNSVKRRSAVETMYGGIEIGSPNMTETHVPTSTAYQTPRPAPSPAAAAGKPKPALKSAGPSRERVQPPRYEQDPTANTRRQSYARHAAKDEPFMHAIPMTKSQERRDRDTKALTSALGLSSPPPPSSCFSPVSLYPDDSLSVAYGLGGGGTRPPSEMPSPTGTHAALGDLMLQDFPSVATFASLKNNDPFLSESKSKKSLVGQLRNGPPRVPSPPPLPSLAQMALENADPDYRSPTYSLYGFYEAQRKSKSSIGGER